MYFKQIRLVDMGCASYLIGSEQNREAVVIDPGWNVEEYLKEAEANGLKITRIFETHLHADHVSGNRRLAQLTGATIYLHKLANAAYPYQPVEGGSVITFGEVKIKVLSTPGHTWESITLLVDDLANPAQPAKLLSGDTLFIGDVGRPDFAGQEGAGTLFDSLQREILPLPDTTEVYPGHLAGSLCGRSMSAAPSSLLGVEKTTNPALQFFDRAAFVNFLTADLPPTPPDFRRIVELNRAGAPVKQAPLPELEWDELQARLAAGAQLIDAREPDEFWSGHLSGSLSVPPGLGQFGANVALFVPPEKPVVLVVNTAQEALQVQISLGVVGRYNLAGFVVFSKVAGLTGSLAQDRRIEARDFASQLENTASAPLVLDVRDPSEYKVDGLRGALNIPARQLPRRLAELETSKDRPLVVLCAAGNRSSLATSYLLSQGWEKALNLRGGMDALKALVPAGQR
jgi:glyoxylase-like metal-dependent hydrolase (beta-lactamase superfamily II)/rhodanese-related sulfurtransferase